MIYIDLLIGFLKVGLFSFGGAYAAIPLIREVVLSYGWINDEVLSYMIAVSESTPGPIMINMATYVGSSQAGFWGAVIATFAVSLPAFAIILLIMLLLKNATENKYVNAVLSGLKPCITGIILAVGIYMIVQNITEMQSKIHLSVRGVVLTVVLSMILFGAKPVLKKKLSPIIFIIISAILGMIVYGL